MTTGARLGDARGSVLLVSGDELAHQLRRADADVKARDVTARGGEGRPCVDETADMKTLHEAVWLLLFGHMQSETAARRERWTNWYRFLMIVRYFAKKFDVKARDMEYALFLAHKQYQKGTRDREL